MELKSFINYQALLGPSNYPLDKLQQKKFRQLVFHDAAVINTSQMLNVKYLHLEELEKGIFIWVFCVLF